MVDRNAGMVIQEGARPHDLAARVTVVDLQPREIECHLCDTEAQGGFGVPIYEDLIVPDDYQGEWGGVPVCPRCFFLVRGLQNEHPGKFITHGFVKKLAGVA